MFKNRTIKIIFPTLLLVILFQATFGEITQANTCESLFISSGAVPVTVRIRIVPDIVVPAIQAFELMQMSTSPADLEQFRAMQEASRAGRTSRPMNARKFNLDVDAPAPVPSQQDKIMGAIRTTAQRELMRMDPLKFAFLSVQSARLQRGDPLTDVLLGAIIKDPVKFAAIYALQGGVLSRSGGIGAILTQKIPWADLGLSEDRAAFDDIARIAKAMNDEPAAQVVSDSMVLETLRARFAPEVAPAVNEAAAGSTGFPR